jgi:hypothetical protein
MEGINPMSEQPVTPSPVMSWLASAQLGVVIHNHGDEHPDKTIDQLMYMIFRLHSELGGDRKVRFQIEVVE